MDQLPIEVVYRFRQFMPYMVYYCTEKRQVFFVNRCYKPLGWPDDSWVEYPDVEGFRTLHLWHPTEMPITENDHEMYRRRLVSFSDYKVIFSPQDKLRIEKPLEYYKQ